MRKVCLLVLIILFSIKPICAEWNDSIRYKIDLEADFGGGDFNPFWFSANRHGVNSVYKNNGYLRAGVYHDMDTTRRFTWGAGLDVAGGWRQESPVHIQQAYGEVKYRCLQAMIGQKEMWGEYTDPRLGSGNMVYSGNALPIPQVRVGIFEYADVWGCKGWFGLKGYIAYGRFTDQRWANSWLRDDPRALRLKEVNYHSKGIWFRFGNQKKFPLQYEFGLEMATQFGGKAYLEDSQTHEMRWYNFSNGIKGWLKAFIPLAAKNSEIVGEDANIEGNVLGAWNVAISWVPQSDWSLQLYYQHFFEDHSMLFAEYPWKDGLVGIKATLPHNRFVSKVVYEFIGTKDQSGPVLWDKTPEINQQVSGRDCYYTNYIYQSWSNWGMGIGSPLCTSPVYNNPHNLKIFSSRILAHHLGFEGEPFKGISYRAKLTHIRSWGTYNDPFTKVKHDFSGMLEVSWKPEKLKGWEGTIGIAGDSGELFGNNLGILLRISKIGWFLKK